MKEKKTKLLYIKNMVLFFMFGIAVALITTYINYHMEYKKIQKNIDQRSLFVSNNIETHIKDYIGKVENSIDAVNENQLFIDFILDPSKNSKKIAEQLFVNSMNNNQNFFQFRFIDTNGKEIIRVDRNKDTDAVFIVKQENLQNKSGRYYFKETINMKNDQYWYSKLDLNIENKEIEKPIRPAFRVSTNVYYKGKHYGILIVNVEMEKLISYIGEFDQFDTFLVDDSGYFLLHPDSRKNWSRYLKTNHNIFKEFPKLTENEFSANNIIPNFYIFSLEKYFNNRENIKLVLLTKEQYIQGMKKNNLQFAITLGIIVLLFSVPIGFAISIPASKLYADINRLLKENLRHNDTIDKYVPTMKVDLNKTITDVSSALCKISGYSKEELIGKSPSLFKSGRMNNEVYKDLWNKITNGLIWHGELENRTKYDQPYWIHITILPNYDQNNQIESYTSLFEDITDKKRIEIISQTDKLTQIYNRVKLDASLEIEFNRFQRYKDIFSIILIDIDHFKSVNDNYGHQVGDSVLIQLSKLLKEHCRRTDIVGRWGGEEFMIICPDTDIKGSTLLAEHLRKQVDEFEFNVVKHKTISVGVAEIYNSDNIETLLKRVDDNLYEAKNSGRNKVVSDKSV
jgi:diguanylate cyclase (GGDEF)-like protein/PAS domain S-box-containing protein